MTDSAPKFAPVSEPPKTVPASANAIPDPNGAPRRGPGRPKGSTNTNAKNVKIDAALATMDSIYSLATAGLLLSNLPQSATLLASRNDALRENNRKAFESSPKLLDAINRLGSTSGFVTFLIGHVAVATPLYFSIRQELAARAHVNEQGTAHEGESSHESPSA